jgi:hypothetical protein
MKTGKIDPKLVINVKDYKQKMYEHIDIRFMDAWINLPPQLPQQNYIDCYGVIKVGENYFVISDLLQDDEKLPSQMNEYRKFSYEAQKVSQMKQSIKQSLMEKMKQQGANALTKIPTLN